jgi:hypothetical protein
MSLLFGFKRFSVVHTCIITFDWVKVKYFDTAGIAMCVEFFGSVNILARLSPLQLMIIPLID